MSSVRLRVPMSVVLRYLCYVGIDFLQTFAASVSWDEGELIRFWGQKVKGQEVIIFIFSRWLFVVFQAFCFRRRTS